MSPLAKEYGHHHPHSRQPTHLHDPSHHQPGNQDGTTTANPVQITYTGLENRRQLTSSGAYGKFKIFEAISIITVFFIFFIGLFCFVFGNFLNRGLKVFGISFICLGIAVLVFIIVKRYHQRTAAAVTVHPNAMVPTMTAQGGIANPSQAGGTTSYLIKTNAMQSGGVAMGTHGCDSAPTEYSVSTAATHYPHPIQSYSGTPHQPSPNGTLPYPPPPVNQPGVSMPYPLPGTPQVNYPVMYTPPPAENSLGVVEPVSEENGLPPPPSYNDVFTGR